MVALGEVLTSVSRPESVDSEKEYRILGAHWYAEGLYIKDIKSGSEIQANKVYRVEKGDFVYNRLFAWKGSFAVATDENHGCYVSNEFPCFKVDSDRADSKYLWLYFSRMKIWEEALGLSSGGTPTSRNRLKEEKFLAMQISLPPLAEQLRIVARIEELAAKIDEARGLRKKAEEEVGALITTALSSVLKPSNSEKPQLLVDYIVDVRYGTSEKCSDEEIGPAVLRMGNIQDGQIRFSQLKYLEPEKIGQDLYLGKGDILFNRTNSAELVGKCGVFESDLRCTFASYLIRIRLDLNRATPKLVAFYINSPLGRKYITSEIKQQCGQANVNSKKLRNMPINLPPLPEQRRIVAYLEDLQAKVDALRRLQAETGAELDALLPAVLDRAFKGEL